MRQEDHEIGAYSRFILDERSAHFFLKGSDSKYFSFLGYMVFVANTLMARYEKKT
jgi:hypothetical protein